jgi:hypothetical protein
VAFGPAPMGFAYFAAIKLAGYTVAGSRLNRVYRTAAPKPLVFGIARTTLGINAGVAFPRLPGNSALGDRKSSTTSCSRPFVSRNGCSFLAVLRSRARISVAAIRDGCGGERLVVRPRHPGDSRRVRRPRRRMDLLIGSEAQGTVSRKESVFRRAGGPRRRGSARARRCVVARGPSLPTRRPGARGRGQARPSRVFLGAVRLKCLRSDRPCNHGLGSEDRARWTRGRARAPAGHRDHWARATAAHFIFTERARRGVLHE